MVLEDVQWADEATLDVLRLVARRLSEVSALLVVTYRSDELGPWHPVRALIGELGARQTLVRISVSPLSLEAVTALAAPFGVDAEAVWARTGGNPFFVTELLTGGDAELSETVSDAVLGRAARLTEPARKLLEAIAVAGPQAELWLLERLVADVPERLDPCLASGLVVSSGDSVSFRHELARDAVAAAISDHRRRALHAAVPGSAPCRRPSAIARTATGHLRPGIDAPSHRARSSAPRRAGTAPRARAAPKGDRGACARTRRTA